MATRKRKRVSYGKTRPWKKIVEDVRAILYPSGHADAEWGADELDAIARVLDRHGLTPRSR